MDRNHKKLSRRRIIKSGIAAGIAGSLPVIVGVRGVMADELPHLDESDGTAKALGYVHDASRVDDATRGGAGHLCKTCRFYTDASAQVWGPCTLFPGKAVNANGWCKGWVAR